MADFIYYVVIFGICVVEISTQSIFKKTDLDVKVFDKTCTRTNPAHPVTLPPLNYFRYLVPSEKEDDILYIGAMNYIFKLDKETMACEASFKKTPNSDDARRCRRQGKSAEPDCQNHIRVIMERDNFLLICGTGAYQPIFFTMDTNITNVDETNGGVARCPFDPLDNFTSIQVADGNPGGSVVAYFGTYTDFVKSSPVIHRPRYVGANDNVTYNEKMTDREEKSWLNAPQFVGSFNEPNSVKFFFREIAGEGDGQVFARVAKVCKHDLGGGHTTVSKMLWLSFQKARLVCSFPGASPYYFNDIYDVFERGNQYYALFYKQGANLNASAICIYDKAEISKVFNGTFQYKNTYNVWEEVPASLNPSPRLDNCSAYVSNPGDFTNEGSKYQLMYNSVQPMFGRPVYYINGIQLLQIAVSEPVTAPNKDISMNIYAASDSGEVYDIFYKKFESYRKHPFITELNSIYYPFASQQNSSFAVWDMKFLKNDTLLGLGTDVDVGNLNLLDLCEKSTKLNTCIRNTKCQWSVSDSTCAIRQTSDSSRKKRSANVDADILTCNNITENGTIESLKLLITPNEKGLNFTEGVSATLPFNSKLHCDEIVWYFNTTSHNTACLNGQNSLDMTDKFAIKPNGDLIIVNVSSADQRTYTACPADHLHITLTSYRVTTARDNNQIIDVWKQQFNDWTTEFTKWKYCSNSFFDECHKP
ncbi:hypothetical protein ACF0H5_012861 [Mactra antiquata]